MRYTIVMTGASRGIGRAAAQALSRRAPDAHLLVVVRDASGRGPAGWLGEVEGQVSQGTADLGSRSGVRAAVAEITDRLDQGSLPPLRAFVGNAGVQYTDAQTVTPEGLEATFAVNVLANHLFVRLLWDRFSAPSRIVLTAGDTHFGDLRHNLGMVPGPAWRSPRVLARPGAFAPSGTATAGRTAYATSKLAVIHLVHEYARRLPAGVEAVAYNPGFVPATGLARDAGRAARVAVRYVLPALTLTPLATGPRTAGRRLADIVLGAVRAPSGSYVDRDRAAPSSPESYDAHREAELWAVLEEFCTY
ncbi:SDR family NAD(P)-dependent oxidoreductase [Streptomyces sp. NPDC002734]|uniref:SDR family NAD(P)-dependent oxidoreductase n=1 Tax=Streptomyces sp. NPDC002734 TaxID=3154426 RepID=UPI00332CF903